MGEPCPAACRAARPGATGGSRARPRGAQRRAGPNGSGRISDASVDRREPPDPGCRTDTREPAARSCPVAATAPACLGQAPARLRQPQPERSIAARPRRSCGSADAASPRVRTGRGQLTVPDLIIPIPDPGNRLHPRRGRPLRRSGSAEHLPGWVRRAGAAGSPRRRWPPRRPGAPWAGARSQAPRPAHRSGSGCLPSRNGDDPRCRYRNSSSIRRR